MINVIFLVTGDRIHLQKLKHKSLEKKQKVSNEKAYVCNYLM